MLRKANFWFIGINKKQSPPDWVSKFRINKFIERQYLLKTTNKIKVVKTERNVMRLLRQILDWNFGSSVQKNIPALVPPLFWHFLVKLMYLTSYLNYLATIEIQKYEILQGNKVSIKHRHIFTFNTSNRCI